MSEGNIASQEQFRQLYELDPGEVVLAEMNVISGDTAKDVVLTRMLASTLSEKIEGNDKVRIVQAVDIGTGDPINGRFVIIGEPRK